MSAAAPFDAVLALIAEAPEPDTVTCRRVVSDLDARAGGLGRLAEIAGWLAEWRGADIAVRRPVIALYISAFARASEPAERASAEGQARLEHLAAGGGAISDAARSLGAGVEVFDLGLARPYPHPAERASLSAREAAATLAFGMEALAKSPDLLVISEATAGAEVPARALLQSLLRSEAEDALDPDTCAAVSRLGSDASLAPLERLREVGGRGATAMLGALVAARTQRTPVLIDGAGAIAAAAVLHALRPDALAHVRLGHAPAQAWARVGAARIGLMPLVDLGIEAGEGVGACAALALVKLASALAAA